MREANGDLWTYPTDVRVITTNGSVRKDGAAIMGRGVALQAKQRYPGIELSLGYLIKRRGNIPVILSHNILTLPVKHIWSQKADISLILNSCGILVGIADLVPTWKIIAMPRPGCGNGGLDWSYVKPLIEHILDDRFVVVQR